MSSISSLLRQDTELCNYKLDDMPSFGMQTSSLNLMRDGFFWNAQSNAFGSAFDPSQTNNINGYIVQCTAINTWFTVADVTNNDGGYLYYIIAPITKFPNGAVQIRVTIDGVETTYDFLTDTSTSEYRYVYGTLIPGFPQRSADTTWKINCQAYGSHYNTDDSSGKLPNRQSDWNRLSTCFLPGVLEIEKYSSRLRWYNSIKVEFNMPYLSTSVYNNYGYAYIKAFQ